MSDKINWTPEELRAFDHLIDLVGSRNQLSRIAGRLKMTAFVNQHGKDKCDAMFAFLQERDAAKARKKAKRTIAQ